MACIPTNKRKHRKHTVNIFYSGNKLHKEKYGFIEIDNPEYYKKDNGAKEAVRIADAAGLNSAKSIVDMNVAKRDKELSR